MKKEYRGKFGNFVHEERKKEEETLEICEDILKNSRNEMFYVFYEKILARNEP